MPRFVVLRHELPAEHERPTHWDLMLEHEGVLKTWALEHEPLTQPTIDAEVLADHRLAYLEYEGPVSGDRGVVSRFDAGAYQLREATADRWIVELGGVRLCGMATLVRFDPNRRWQVTFSAGV